MKERRSFSAVSLIALILSILAIIISALGYKLSREEYASQHEERIGLSGHVHLAQNGSFWYETDDSSGTILPLVTGFDLTNNSGCSIAIQNISYLQFRCIQDEGPWPSYRKVMQRGLETQKLPRTLLPSETLTIEDSIWYYFPYHVRPIIRPHTGAFYGGPITWREVRIGWALWNLLDQELCVPISRCPDEYRTFDDVNNIANRDESFLRIYIKTTRGKLFAYDYHYFSGKLAPSDTGRVVKT